MIEPEELKRKLLGLWERTTHNSRELLSVLFDFYFNPEYIEYKESEGKIVSAVCGIPYFFGNAQTQLKGLYLIILSSEEGYRKKGVLSGLLNSINEKAAKDFDFTFIVPHTDMWADYYGQHGYQSSFFILEERFTTLHDFRNDYLLSLTDSDERIRELKKDLLNQIKVINKKEGKFSDTEICNFIETIEKKIRTSEHLIHTSKDLQYLLGEKTIRNLNIFVSFDTESKITGIAFTQNDDVKRIRVVAFFVEDTCSYYALLDHIKKQFQDYSLSVNTSDPKYQIHSIIQRTYASSNPNGGDLDNTFSTIDIPFSVNKLLQPLGMVRLLKFENIFKHIAETRRDIEFKVYIRNYKPDILENETNRDELKKDKEFIFVVRNGHCKILPYDKEKEGNNSILNLSKHEISELLLRKNDSSNLIMEAFGIPRLNLQMRLLPC